ncbi:MAG: RbsD/FucU domain-containing protein [Betaproteobacteria bacterium]
MLKGIHPLLHADLLHALAAMGHGDELAIVDANFPAARVGRRVIQSPTPTSAATLEAVLTVFPVDDVVRPAAVTMKVIGDVAKVPEPVHEFAALLESHMPLAAMGSVERAAFYERARNAFVIVRTAEMRGYGNLILVKGVVTEYSERA